MKELGIYVHIPFCKQKCSYCDFISYWDKNDLVEKYIEALKQEIKTNTEDVSKYEISTIYIGGGTPSYIESKHIEEILKTIKKKYNVSKNAEITIEVNPGSATKEKLECYAEAGINRISIGLQSCNNNLLKMIGRIHTYEDFLSTYKLAREVGFKNINVDLMIGLPNQTLEDVKKSLEEIIKLNPEHISVYSLIVEEGTPIEKKIVKGELKLPNEELERKEYWEVKITLESSGYKHYEISNFAKRGYESKHNLNCWEQKEYLGFGVAAHSYMNGVRYSNVEHIEEYLKKEMGSEKCEVGKNTSNIIHEIQTEENKKKEYMLLGLRKIDGIKISSFKNKFGCNPIMEFKNELNKLVQEKLIEIDLDQIKLTKKGIDLANLVWEEFI
ncbi:MAG: radical SAM family heme chaperone HemW [Clostridia bacterium]